jgi:hypothetical protein
MGAGTSAQALANGDAPVDTAVVVDLGNRITATVDSDSGQVRVTTPTPLIWDPNLTNVDHLRAGMNRFGFGVGWTFAAPGWPGGTRFVVAEGGATMYFPDLGQFYQLDASTETGLRAYPRNDVLVKDHVDYPVLAPRRDVPARQYRFTLLQLEPNIMEYYGWFGDLIATVNLTTGDRWDWVYDWSDEVGNDDHNLTRVVDQNGANFLRVDQPNRREWFELHTTDGRITQVFVDGAYDKISRMITGTARTQFDFPNDYGNLPWFTNVDTPSADGYGIEVEFTWDPARPGSATRVERCVERVCSEVFPIPWRSRAAGELREEVGADARELGAQVGDGVG